MKTKYIFFLMMIFVASLFFPWLGKTFVSHCSLDTDDGPDWQNERVSEVQKETAVVSAHNWGDALKVRNASSVYE